jgi:hypothetical protein
MSDAARQRYAGKILAAADMIDSRLENRNGFCRIGHG